MNKGIRGVKLFKGLYYSKENPEEVINELKNSGLRGLGGAGFPAGTKWEIVKKFPAPRLLAVNIEKENRVHSRTGIFLKLIRIVSWKEV
ncbi:MAG: hypothetical protein Ct9H300mP28_13590 [Pseudomonadota bacterium]|nr:MAG: hypothetical protein Ct9H300mP28_13590 [Pseudomonadota bacterium]